MKEISIEELAYDLKLRGQCKPIFILGAGASVTGNIPLAGGIIEDILNKYSDNPRIKNLKKEEKTYANLMDKLHPAQRNDLLKSYIDNAKINVTHIYLAQLLEAGYVDYILTVNFDNLMLRALALFNYFPPVYDMAIMNDITTSNFIEKSVVYLHGQHQGQWLLNTSEEMSKVNETVPKIFNKISNQRPWIILGYSGNDLIFNHLKNLGRFDNGLYWVCYNDDLPSQQVQEFLNQSNINASLIKGYDADSFMLKLNNELKAGQPDILSKPFTSLKKILSQINDINDDDHFVGVKKRLEIARKNVEKAIRTYEKYDDNISLTIDQVFLKKPTVERNKQSDLERYHDILITDIIRLIINEDFDKEKVNAIAQKARLLDSGDVNDTLSDFYINWGNTLDDLAKIKQGEEAEALYKQAIDKYRQALEIKPDKYEALNNWGNALGKLAATKQGHEAESLYEQAFEKYCQALSIKPDKHETLYNWGNEIINSAKTKQGNKIKELYQQAFEKYRQALAIKPDFHKALFNWGKALTTLAGTKQGSEAEALYQQAFDKYHQASAIKQDTHKPLYNWGVTLTELAKTKQGTEAEALYLQAFKKYRQALAIKPDDIEALNNWGIDLTTLAGTKQGREAEALYQQAFEKYRQVLAIKPDLHEALYNWGFALIKLAEKKQGKEAEALFKQASDKCRQALEIKPNLHDALVNWGFVLTKLAGKKRGREAEALYQQAFEKYRQALAIKPDSSEALYNLGKSFSRVSRVQAR